MESSSHNTSQFTLKSFDSLPEEARQIRTAVFMEEQGFEEEFDDIDSQATHIVAYDGSHPAATCRFFWDEEQQSYVIGRVAVNKQYRGQHLGSTLLAEAERLIRQLNADSIRLAAQQRAMPFYASNGYHAQGEPFPEEGCPHVWMVKTL